MSRRRQKPLQLLWSPQEVYNKTEHRMFIGQAENHARESETPEEHKRITVSLNFSQTLNKTCIFLWKWPMDIKLDINLAKWSLAIKISPK